MHIASHNARYSASVSATLGVIRRLYYRVICQVQEHDNVIGYPAFLKGTAEDNLPHHTLHPSQQIQLANFLIGVISQRCLTARSVQPAGHEADRFRRKSAASVRGSGSSVHRSRKYRYGYSYGDTHGIPDLTAVR